VGALLVAAGLPHLDAIDHGESRTAPLVAFVAVPWLAAPTRPCRAPMTSRSSLVDHYLRYLGMPRGYPHSLRQRPPKPLIAGDSAGVTTPADSEHEIVDYSRRSPQRSAPSSGRADIDSTRGNADASHERFLMARVMLDSTPICPGPLAFR